MKSALTPLAIKSANSFKINGVEAMEKIIARDRKIPVIFYSAYPAFKSNFLTWAADAFVVKSGNPMELVNAVRKVSEERGIEIPPRCKMITEPKCELEK